jgi:hypothetical protein
LGQRFLKLGAARSALQIFEQLHLWPEIIQCYQIMNETKKVQFLLSFSHCHFCLYFCILILIFVLFFDIWQAEEIVRAQLEELRHKRQQSKNEDKIKFNQAQKKFFPSLSESELLCLLGELTNDPKYFHEAWEISGYRFARAKRLLAVHCVKQNKVLDLQDEFEFCFSFLIH